MRLNNTEINNLAVFTGVKTDALKKFINKYNLDVAKLNRDVMKYKRVRLDLVTAVSGYDYNETAQELVSNYRLDEGKRANEFFATSNGYAIFNLLKRNGKVFNRELVAKYLDGLNTNDLKWARIMDFIASNLGLDYKVYSTFKEQESAMLDVIERLYQEYTQACEKVIITKMALNELVEKALVSDLEVEREREHLKRMVINIVQFEALLNHILNPLNKSVTINEGVLDDTYTFEVPSSKLKNLIDFLKLTPTISIDKIKKDGNTLYVTLLNNGKVEDWGPVLKFYKGEIQQ